MIDSLLGQYMGAGAIDPVEDTMSSTVIRHAYFRSTVGAELARSVLGWDNLRAEAR